MSLPEVISILRSHFRRYYCIFDYIYAILHCAVQSLIKVLWMTKAIETIGVELPEHGIADFSAIRHKIFVTVKDRAP